MNPARWWRWSLTLAVLCAALPSELAAQTPLRLAALHRCGDLLHPEVLEFCIRVRGAESGPMRLVLDGTVIGSPEAADSEIKFALDRRQHQSGPLWVEQGESRSNAAWLSMQRSATIAAHPDEVTKNDDGITTYLNLVSIVIEEDFEPDTEIRRLAEKYGAQVVGVIPPLRIFQIRLPARDLVHRDALVLRLNGEESVDSVVVEESASEDGDKAVKENPTPPSNAASIRELAANRFMDAVDYYRRRIPGPPQAAIRPEWVRIGVIERDVDFDTPDLRALVAPAEGDIRLYARDAEEPDGHGTRVASVLAAEWDDIGNTGFLRGLKGHHGGIDVIVDRGSDGGIAANVATSVRLVEDGARVLNWSWGVHRLGTVDARGNDIDSAMRSGIAFEGYEELLEEFFKWLRREHPDVVIVNSAGNSVYYNEGDDYRLPSSLLTPQLLVVGAHQRTSARVSVRSPDFAKSRRSSNLGARVDITASGCVQATDPSASPGELHCGTSYATPLVTGVVAAVLTINPRLRPSAVRTLLRRASLPIGGDADFEPADLEDLTAPILPSERAEQLDHPDVGRSARLDMLETLTLAVDSLTAD